MSEPTYTYRPEWVAEYFNGFGDQEWERLVKTPTEEIKLFVHAHHLRAHTRPGDYVLEIGAGAGRFTQVLVELGANVLVADISSVQLDLNKQYAAELGFAQGVEDWLLLDVCDMSRLADAQFDLVVCYGGPLSYVFEQRGQALQEILRVLKPNGKALLSVMSLWGTLHEYLPGVLPISAEANARIIATGDLCPANLASAQHHCHMFRAEEFRAFLQQQGAVLLGMSASDCLSAAWKDRLVEIRADPAQWQQLLQWEIEACQDSGCLDMGTHLIAIIGKQI